MRQISCTAHEARWARPDPLRAAATLAALVSLVGWSADLAAQATQAAPAFALEWAAPSECPDSEMIQRAVANYLQGDHLPVALRAVARIDRVASSAYALTLQLDHDGEHAERALSGADCAALAQAAALLIAIAINPSLEAQAASSAAKPDAPEPAPASPATAAQRAPTSPVPNSRRAREGATTRTADASGDTSDRAAGWGVALSFVLDAGALPNVGLGTAAALELRLAWVRFAFGAQVLVPNAKSVPTLGDAAVRIGGAMGVARVCARLLTSDTLELAPCAGLELGALWGSATGIEDPGRGDALWFAFGPGVEGRALLGAGFAAVADAGLLVPSARQRFFVRTGQGPVSAHRVSPIALRASLAIAYEFH